MLPWSADLSGRIDRQTITSELLKDNPLKDPCERPLWVYLPPGYDAEPDRRYPSVAVRHLREAFGFMGVLTPIDCELRTNTA